VAREETGVTPASPGRFAVAAAGPPAHAMTAQPPLSCQQSAWCGAPQTPHTAIVTPSFSEKRQYGHARPVSAWPAID
jgi:hypothetical protein